MTDSLLVHWAHSQSCQWQVQLIIKSAAYLAVAPAGERHAYPLPFSPSLNLACVSCQAPFARQSSRLSSSASSSDSSELLSSTSKGRFRLLVGAMGACADPSPVEFASCFACSRSFLNSSMRSSLTLWKAQHQRSACASNGMLCLSILDCMRQENMGDRGGCLQHDTLYRILQPAVCSL